MPTLETTLAAAPWLAAIAVLTAVLVVSEWRYSRFVPWTKSAASLAFLATAAMTSPWSGGGPARAILVGLVLSALGDVLLLQRGTGWGFKAGLFAFLGGHLAYLAAFLLAGVSASSMALAALPIVVLAAAVARVMVPAAPPHLRGPVVAYIVVITVMVAAAGARWLDEAPGALLLLLAATLFWISDVFVARQRFVAPGMVNRAVGLPLYYAAQACFALSLW